MKISQIQGGYWVPDDTHIGKWQKECGRLDHDAYLLPKILEHIPVGGNVIDVGAFNGDHALSYARKAGKDGYVLAIEAGEVAYDCLYRNACVMRENKTLAPVSVCHCAIGHYPSLTGHHENENLGASRCGPSSGNVHHCHPVSVLPIDFFIPLFDSLKLHLIKMDIEGWEVNAILGGLKLIQKHWPVLVLEVNDGALRSCGHSSEKLLYILKALKYKIEKIPESEPWDAPQYDVICTPL